MNHEVSLKDGILKSIYQKDSLKVNSVHHQGVKKLGKDLTPEAYSEKDNLIEGFTLNNEQQYILAVQWHPEFSKTLGDKIDSPKPIIDDFLKAAKNYQQNKK